MDIRDPYREHEASSVSKSNERTASNLLESPSTTSASSSTSLPSLKRSYFVIAPPSDEENEQQEKKLKRVNKPRPRTKALGNALKSTTQLDLHQFIKKRDEGPSKRKEVEQQERAMVRKVSAQHEKARQQETFSKRETVKQQELMSKQSTRREQQEGSSLEKVESTQSVQDQLQDRSQRQDVKQKPRANKENEDLPSFVSHQQSPSSVTIKSSSRQPPRASLPIEVPARHASTEDVINPMHVRSKRGESSFIAGELNVTSTPKRRKSSEQAEEQAAAEAAEQRAKLLLQPETSFHDVHDGKLESKEQAHETIDENGQDKTFVRDDKPKPKERAHKSITETDGNSQAQKSIARTGGKSDQVTTSVRGGTSKTQEQAPKSIGERNGKSGHAVDVINEAAQHIVRKLRDLAVGGESLHHREITKLGKELSTTIGSESARLLDYARNAKDTYLAKHAGAGFKAYCISSVTVGSIPFPVDKQSKIHRLGENVGLALFLTSGKMLLFDDRLITRPRVEKGVLRFDYPSDSLGFHSDSLVPQSVPGVQEVMIKLVLETDVNLLMPKLAAAKMQPKLNVKRLKKMNTALIERHSFWWDKERNAPWKAEDEDEHSAWMRIINCLPLNLRRDLLAEYSKA